MILAVMRALYTLSAAKAALKIVAPARPRIIGAKKARLARTAPQIRVDRWGVDS